MISIPMQSLKFLNIIEKRTHSSNSWSHLILHNEWCYSSLHQKKKKKKKKNKKQKTKNPPTLYNVFVINVFLKFLILLRWIGQSTAQMVGWSYFSISTIGWSYFSLSTIGWPYFSISTSSILLYLFNFFFNKSKYHFSKELWKHRTNYHNFPHYIFANFWVVDIVLPTQFQFARLLLGTHTSITSLV